MTAVCHEIIAPYSCRQMYVLVSDISSYDQFIPWCSESVIEEVRSDTSVLATLKIQHKGISAAFTTLNENIPEEQVIMKLVSGPFEHLKGEWKFIALGEGCKVSFCLDYRFSNLIYASLLGPVFDKVTNSIITAFLDRARQVYA